MSSDWGISCCVSVVQYFYGPKKSNRMRVIGEGCGRSTKQPREDVVILHDFVIWMVLCQVGKVDFHCSLSTKEVQSHS